MVNGNKIIILEEYKNFKLLDSFENCQVLKKGEIFSCPGLKEWKQRIQFWDSSLKRVITLDLYDRTGITKVVALSGNRFEKQEYENLCKSFGLHLRVDPQLYAVILVNGESKVAHLAIQHLEDETFCLIFNLDDGESRRNATLYIHGIWKVVLPGFITDKLPYRT